MTAVAARATRRRVVIGRSLAATAIVLAAGGAIALAAMGRLDHLPEGVAMFTLVAFGFGALAWLAIPRQPHNRAVWVPLWPALASGLGVAGWATTVLIGGLSGLDVSAGVFDTLTPSDFPLAAALVWQLVNTGAVFFLFPMLTLWLLLFPDGELPSSKWRWVAWAAVTTMLALLAVLLWTWRPSSTVRLRESGDPGLQVLYSVLLGISAACVVSLVLRYRRSTGDTRPQYRWVLLGTASLYFAVFVVDEPTWQLLAALGGVTVGIACYGVAVTKYRLYDIDIVISRTLAYGTLAAFIGAFYVIIVVVVGGTLGSGAGSLPWSIAATAVVAVAFEPLRQRVQRWANRLVFGRRATPYEVLSDLTRRLAGTEPARGVLDRMVRLMAEGTGAEVARVWMAEPQGLRAAAGWPQPPSAQELRPMDELDGVSFPVVHEGELVGVLELVKARGNPVTPAERRLLSDLAGSAGAVLGNQRLNAALAVRADELRASRRRLVEAQDSERRLLERNLHDGAQQQVVALKVQIRLAEQLARAQGAEPVADVLAAVASETQEAVDEIRALAKGIYPPLLESEGLEVAVRALGESRGSPVELKTEGLVGRYSREIESAVYLCVSRVLAQDGGISLALHDRGETLEFVITGAVAAEDDSLIDMRDRIEALGGEISVSSGGRLTGSIPVGSY